MTRRWSSPGTGTNCHQTATSANAVARRHFARHVSEPEFWPISEAETPANDSRSGDELDAHAILESSTKALTEMMESLVRQYRATAAQQPYAAERLLTTFMKVQAALARSLKQRDDDQLRREEFRKTVPQIVERCTSEAMLSILPLMRKNMTNLHEEVTEYANGTLGVEEFWRRLVRYEVEWPKEVGARMRVAQTQALKAEEVKV